MLKKERHRQDKRARQTAVALYHTKVILITCVCYLGIFYISTTGPNKRADVNIKKKCTVHRICTILCSIPYMYCAPVQSVRMFMPTQ